MNKIKLSNQLKIDEGVRLNVYRDSKKFLTVGVGHLVLPKDNLKFGDRITIEQCNNFLTTDIDIAIDSCIKVFVDFNTFQDSLQQIIANMMFNLGIDKFKGFVELIKAIKNKDYNKAADEMVNSKWYKEVKIRAKRLEREMRNLNQVGRLDVS